MCNKKNFCKMLETRYYLCSVYVRKHFNFSTYVVLVFFLVRLTSHNLENAITDMSNMNDNCADKQNNI